MACVCKRCLEHARMLGLARGPSSPDAVRKAFRAAAKLWHPDRFENDPKKRLEAEEHFKRIQVAYRELWEHVESPELEAVAAAPAERQRDAPPAKEAEPESPAIFFGGAPGCYVAPRFPPQAHAVMAEVLQATECALALVDLSGGAWKLQNLSSFVLLTSYRMIVRNEFQIISLLWYTDMGNVTFVDLRTQGKQGIWQRIASSFSGKEHEYALQIYRHDGALFYSIGSELDDMVKKVIYNFLLQMKPQPRS